MFSTSSSLLSDCEAKFGIQPPTVCLPLKAPTTHLSCFLIQIQVVPYKNKQINNHPYNKTYIKCCRASPITFVKGDHCIYHIYLLYVLFHRKTSFIFGREIEIESELFILSNMKDLNFVSCHNQSHPAVIYIFLLCTFGQYSPSPTCSTCFRRALIVGLNLILLIVLSLINV